MTLARTPLPLDQPRRILAWRGGVACLLFDVQDVGAASPLASMLVERCDVPASHRSQRRMLRSHVLSQFVSGGVIEHAMESLPARRIVVPHGAVVCSLRDLEEDVRIASFTDLFAVELSDEFLAATARSLHDSDAFELRPSPGLSDPRVSGLMTALRAEQASGWTAGPLFAECVQQALAALLLAPPLARPERPRGLSAPLAKRVAELVQDKLATPLRLVDLASATGYSVAQFTRLFRETFGTSPHRFVTTRRIEHARTLLRETRKSQLEVAMACGFQSQQHFSRAFRSQTGLSPNAYRLRK